MPERILITVDDGGLRAALARARAQLQDTSPIMREIAGIMKAASDRAFLGEKDPATDAGWVPLSPRWRARRAKMGYDGPILQMKGQLKASVQVESGQTFARVGTNKEYAAAHQFGATIQRKAGNMTVRLRKKEGRWQFAKKSHKRVREVGTMRKAYTVRIPARPFLGVGQEDIDDMLNAIARRVTGAFAENAV